LVKLTSPYSYTKLDRIEDKGVRLYLTPSGHKLPSVTTVLSKTTDVSFLDTWRERIGDSAADEILRQSSGTGSQMHDSLENYILHGTNPTGNYYSRMMAKMIIDRGLCNVSEVWGCEVPLYYDGLYAGTADLIGVHKGRPAIIDFKNSRSNKTIDDIINYRCQGAAYALAHNRLYGTDISTIVIMMARHDGGYTEFDINGLSYDDSVNEWVKRLDQYYT